MKDFMEDFNNGNFITAPKDVFTLMHTSGLISDSLSIKINRSGKTFYFGLKNNIESWTLLKKLNEMGARTVLYQIDNETPIAFEDSYPYRYRFSSRG